MEYRKATPKEIAHCLRIQVVECLAAMEKETSPKKLRKMADEARRLTITHAEWLEAQ